MLKTAIVVPPASSFRVSPFPVLGPAILKSFLDSNGYKADFIDLSIRVSYLNRFRMRKIFDLKIFYNTKDLVNFLENGRGKTIRAEVEKFIALGHLTNYDVIGFSLSSIDHIASALCISKILKEKYNKKIVFGGPITSRTDYSYLLDFDFVDFLVVGDGEEPFLKILHFFDNSCNIKNYDGIFYKKNGRIHKSKPSVFPLEKKPIPSFNTEDLKLYNKLRALKLSILPYLLSRGCKYKCAFCCEYGNSKFEYMPLEKAISDIKVLLKTYNATSLFFAESNTDNNQEYLQDLSKRIISEKLKFAWGGQTTISGLDKNTIKIMARAGCQFVIVGLESASESVRDRMLMRKAGNLEKFKETLKLLHRYKIRTHNFYIVEFPHETDEEFKENIKFLNETASYLTTAFCDRFLLLENSTIFSAPHAFNIRIRKNNDGKFDFLNRWRKFDDVGGLKWEEKERRGIIKKRMINGMIHRRIRWRLRLTSLFKHPSYTLRKVIYQRYSNYDEYFL